MPNRTNHKFPGYRAEIFDSIADALATPPLYKEVPKCPSFVTSTLSHTFHRSYRNRAIHNDVVAVRLLPRSQWRSRNNALPLTGERKAEEGSEGEIEGDGRVLPTGEVVGIVERADRQYVATFDVSFTYSFILEKRTPLFVHYHLCLNIPCSVMGNLRFVSIVWAMGLQCFYNYDLFQHEIQNNCINGYFQGLYNYFTNGLSFSISRILFSRMATVYQYFVFHEWKIDLPVKS